MSEEALPAWAKELLAALRRDAPEYGIDPALIQGCLLVDWRVKIVENRLLADPGTPLYASQAETEQVGVQEIAKKKLSAWREEAKGR